MEFRVLGALELARDGRVERVPGRVRPRLLAMLLLDPGRVVSVDRLVDGVWDGEPPATARAQVRNGCAALRKHLDDGRLAAVAGGYRLNLAGATVDARRFADAVAKARGLIATGDRRAAVAELRLGLELWRGNAFEGLPGRAVAAGAAHLAELRLAALEDRIELDLSLSGPSHVVDELRRLVHDHPYRQRLTGLLMLALYRDGRTSDALDAYRNLRTRLADDLGLDPDLPLRQRHAAILRGDTVDGPCSPGGPASGTNPAEPTVRIPVPAQLPACPATFVGRLRQLSRLDDLLRGTGSGRACVITGTGGAGKTALAVYWGHQVRDRFPDGQLYVNLRGFDSGEPTSAHAVLERFLTALGKSGAAIPSDVDAAAALFRSLVADRRMLLVLDNARDVGQVRPLLPGGARNLTVVTSRDSLAGLTALEGAVPLDLRTLTEPESLDLLAELVGAKRLRASSGAARRLARLCGGLPLALRIAAANFIERPHATLDGYVSELDGTRRLDLLAVDGDPNAAVADTFEHSYRNLEPGTRELFLRLGLMPVEDFCDGLAADAAGLGESETREHLTRLRTAHLLEEHRPGRHRFHDLVRLYARRRAERTLADADRDATVERFIDWHYQRVLALPLEETANIIAAGAQLADHPGLWRLVAALQAVVYAGQLPGHTRGLIEAGLRHTEQHRNRRGRSQLTGLLGAWHRVDGDLERARSLGQRAVALAKDTDPITEGLALGNFGATLIYYGDYHRAESILLEAWRISIVVKPKVWQQATAYFLGMLYGRLGDFAKAFDYLAASDDLYGQYPTTSGSTINQLVRARLLIDTGRHDEARIQLDRVFAEIRGGDDARAHCDHLSASGDLARTLGDLPGARRYFEEMRAVARQRGMSLSEVEAGAKLATVLAEAGEHHAAIEIHKELSDAEPRLLGPLTEATVALSACVVHTEAGSYDTALAAGNRAVELFAAMPDPSQRARSLVATAAAYDGLGRAGRARHHRETASGIRARIGVPDDATSAAPRR